MKKIILLFILFLVIVTASVQAFEQQVIANVVFGEMQIYSPIEGKVYNNRMIPINITMNDYSIFKYAKYSDNGDPYVTLCRNCDEYGYSKLKRKPFSDGFHRMGIKVEFEDGPEYSYVEFFVDSRKPRIRRTEPRRGFAFGLFEVEFDEENPEEVWLNYGNDLTGWESKELDLSECVKGRRGTICEIWIDLDRFDGQEIEYWFNITDIAENKDESKHEFVKVDNTAPIINSVKYIADKRRGEIIVDITEANLDKIEYIDNNDDRARWRTLCRRLDRDDGLCHGRARFRDGTHNVTLKAIDEAGLETLYYMDEFFTDSKAPRIRGTEPRRGFASGLFQVEFDEENPEEVWLNYGNFIKGFEAEQVNISSDNCIQDRRITRCGVFVNLTDYDGQEIEYWFNITDIVGNEDESRIRDLKVDIISPVINYFNYTIDRRRVEFIFNITEKNFDEINYIDWNDRRPRERTLCRRLDKDDRDDITGICEEREYFRNGEHNLTIEIRDEAGNKEIIEDVVFEIF